ncbi:MAG TPA: ferritin family protein [Epulopiscium sp.]|nr:ferritin family protein [Candidatus Epulonipiscium sp.]
MNVLAVAIAMEVDLEQYYLKQAEMNKDNSLNNVFTMLAKDEREHANILRSKSEELSYELKASETLVESKRLFKEIENFALDIKELPTQLDSFRLALEMEKKSIDAYEKILAETTDEKAKGLFEFLINQEKDHYKIIEQLVIHLTRPEEWVEDAEFGVREDY